MVGVNGFQIFRGNIPFGTFWIDYGGVFSRINMNMIAVHI